MKKKSQAKEKKEKKQDEQKLEFGDTEQTGTDIENETSPETDQIEDEENIQTDEADDTSSELDEMKDRYMRLLAEYDNFRKRSKTERDSVYSEAVSDASKEWLSVLDNIERALGFSENTAEDENAKNLTDGVGLVYKQALEVLEKLGITEIPCEIGFEFDPNVHSAVTHIEDENLGEQCIAAIFQKGYQKGDRIIRFALVQVAN